MRRFYAFFFFSGLCSIVYELIWMRLSMATFGVTTPLVSIVLSVFMAGLGLGSWFSAYIIDRNIRRKHLPALWIYGTLEAVIGMSAFVVPLELSAARGVFNIFASSGSSLSFYVYSATWIGASLLPWCVCMGATIPLGMKAVEETVGGDRSKSFSYLYVANLAGAILGTIVPLFTVEVIGFTATLRGAAVLNLAIAISAVWLAQSTANQKNAIGARRDRELHSARPLKQSSWILALLFMTGFSSMAMELIWTRLFTPYLGTFVYAFSIILASYLAWAFIGGRAYRRQPNRAGWNSPIVFILIAGASVLPAFAAEPTFNVPRIIALVVSIGPITAIVGFLTPMLVDVWSGGDSELAGRAYAVNILGCILGPLVASFLLLPYVREPRVLMLFALAWAALALFVWTIQTLKVAPHRFRSLRRKFTFAICAIAILLSARLEGFEGRIQPKIVRRDHTASVVAAGTGKGKHLYVNGIGVTVLTPSTKLMAHLPLAFLAHRPQRVLIICLGMGTTFRSALSWNVPTTAVELVPKVPDVMWYFHPDAEQLLRSPLSTIVVDDGRRFLERTHQQFDVIAIDPPPPVEAAGSSMLYSEEFYAVARQHLRPGGILQQWIPKADHPIRSAIAQALKNSFPNVRAYEAIDGYGVHFLASASPLSSSPAALASRLPRSAATDLLEWGPYGTAEAQFAAVLAGAIDVDGIIAEDSAVPALRDNRPVNEYFLLRALGLIR